MKCDDTKWQVFLWKYISCIFPTMLVQISMDVEHFAPTEISVLSVGNVLSVEGKHEEKEDQLG